MISRLAPRSNGMGIHDHACSISHGRSITIGLHNISRRIDYMVVLEDLQATQGASTEWREQSRLMAKTTFDHLIILGSRLDLGQDLDPDPDPDRNTDPDPNPDRDTDRDQDPDRDRDPDPDRDRDTDPDQDSDRDSDPDQDSDRDSDPDPDQIPAQYPDQVLLHHLLCRLPRIITFLF
jgi:hypothetical protein